VKKWDGHSPLFPQISSRSSQAKKILPIINSIKKIIHHLFCKTCGVRSFGRATGKDGNESVAINVLCLDGIDHDTLKPFPYNGKDISTKNPPKPLGQGGFFLFKRILTANNANKKQYDRNNE
jgi:hypothetical protein